MNSEWYKRTKVNLIAFETCNEPVINMTEAVEPHLTFCAIFYLHGSGRDR